jgi:hypothetical protein
MCRCLPRVVPQSRSCPPLSRGRGVSGPFSSARGVCGTPDCIARQNIGQWPARRTCGFRVTSDQLVFQSSSSTAAHLSACALRQDPHAAWDGRTVGEEAGTVIRNQATPGRSTFHTPASKVPRRAMGGRGPKREDDRHERLRHDRERRAGNQHQQRIAPRQRSGVLQSNEGRILKRADHLGLPLPPSCFAVDAPARVRRAARPS